MAEPPERDHTGPGNGRRRLLRGIGAITGAALVWAAAPGFAPAAGPASLPLTVDASLVRSGEVGVVGDGLLLTGARVRLGERAAEGRREVVSQTAVPVTLTLSDVGPPTGWEEETWLHIAVGDRVIFHGSRSALRQKTSSPVTVAPGTRVPVSLEVSVPEDAPDVYQGRSSDIRLQIVTTPLGPAGG